MPVQKGKAPASALGGALRGHAKDETTVRQDFGDLPNGMTGTARIVKAALRTYNNGDNKGQPYIYIEARVLTPDKAVRTVRAWRNGAVEVVSQTEEIVKGRMVNQMLPLCPTGKPDTDRYRSADENAAAALNEIRTLGYDTAAIAEAPPGGEEAVLEAILAQMAADGPTAKITTSDMKPSADRPGTPRVFVNWHGAVDVEHPDGPDAGAVGVDAEANGQAPDAAPPQADDDGGEDLDALAAAADANDGTDDCVNAGTRLLELAKEQGIEEDAVNGADSWSQVVEWIRNADGDDPSANAAPAEPWKPTKGAKLYYRTLNKQTGRKAKFQCEVVAVDGRKKTMTLQNLDNKRLAPYKDVPWDSEDVIVEE